VQAESSTSTRSTRSRGVREPQHHPRRVGRRCAAALPDHRGNRSLGSTPGRRKHPQQEYISSTPRTSSSFARRGFDGLERSSSRARAGGRSGSRRRSSRQELALTKMFSEVEPERSAPLWADSRAGWPSSGYRRTRGVSMKRRWCGSSRSRRTPSPSHTRSVRLEDREDHLLTKRRWGDRWQGAQARHRRTRASRHPRRSSHEVSSTFRVRGRGRGEGDRVGITNERSRCSRSPRSGRKKEA